MPKMKSHSGAKKRFKLTANKKVKFQRANRRHRLISKETKVKHKNRQGGILKECDAVLIRRLLPYD